LKILPKLRIGKLQPKFPIMQGGMAIRVSTGKLAGAVAREGGIGLIAGSGMKLDKVRHEIRQARSIANGGIVGINPMVVDDCEAGGHLGADRLARDIFPEVKASVKIPVLLAGGVIDQHAIIAAFKFKIKKCLHQFCIVRALIEAREGHFDRGLVFAGEHVYRIKEILSVGEIFDRFFTGLENAG